MKDQAQPIYAHPAWQRLIEEAKMHPARCLQIDFQNGIPMNVVVVRKDQKMKLA